MPIHDSISKNHISGEFSTESIVRGDDSDTRAWLSDAPICPSLAAHRIAHCGMITATAPYEVLRADLSGTFFLATLDGTGEVLIDGQYKQLGAGHACIQPPLIPNALRFEKRPKQNASWRFAYVRYQELPENRPIVLTHSPVTGSFDADAMVHALRGLHAESSGSSLTDVTQLWADLIHRYVRSFAQPALGDPRLAKAWVAVSEDLARDWTLDEIAKIASVSKEQLRRLSIKTLGRTPKQHVTFLRMHEAARRLALSDDKLSTIARRTGYSTAFAFSEAFRRWMGRRPSDYRTQSQQQENEE